MNKTFSAHSPCVFGLVLVSFSTKLADHHHTYSNDYAGKTKVIVFICEIQSLVQERTAMLLLATPMLSSLLFISSLSLSDAQMVLSTSLTNIVLMIWTNAIPRLLISTLHILFQYIVKQPLYFQCSDNSSPHHQICMQL